MLQLAGLSDGDGAEYENQLNNDELRHPLLASLRVRIQKSEPVPPSSSIDATVATEHSQQPEYKVVVVEAQKCSYTDIPTDSVDAIHGLLAGRGLTSDRLASVRLDQLEPSPFCNMLVDGEPVEKTLALVHFTRRTNGKQISNGFRLVAEHVRDDTDTSSAKVYITHVLCSVEKAPDFTASKDATALAVISKVVAPSKPEYAADLYIEAMEIVPSHHREEAVLMMAKLQGVSKVPNGDAIASNEAAWQQRKCRRLARYPTRT